MHISAGIAALFILLGMTMPVNAQQYGFDSQCRPLPPPGWMVMPQEPSRTCLSQRAEATRRAEMEIERRQKRAAAEAAEEAARQQKLQEEQAAAAREVAIAAENAAYEKARIKRIAFDNQRSAELSPDNHCREHDVARHLLEEWSRFKTNRENDLTAIDIEHLTTIHFDATSSTMVCRGVFVIDNGIRLLGIMEIRKNVAGDPIITWKPEYPQDLTQFEEPPVPVQPVPTPSATTVAAALPSYSQASSQGSADRRRWETWHDALSGDELAGATWWAGQRSLPHPGSCADLASQRGEAWSQGCLEAKQMLAPFDVKRVSDPNYRAGWNNY